MRSRWGLAAVVTGALALALPAVPARAEAPGPVLFELCTEAGIPDIPELGPRTCASVAAGSTLLAQLCAQTVLPAAACAGLTDGHVVDPAQVDAFEQTWAYRALRLQLHLDDDEPLRNTLWPHTHNSFNASVYAPSVADLDPNQRYSIGDQLRMGVRAIELDVHWFLDRVVLCHGQGVAAGDLTIHVGCSVDRPFRDGLEELRAFLDAPGNEDEVVLLYLENNLDGDPEAHDLVAADLEAVLGGLVARPPAGRPCAPMPLDTTKAALRAAGHRVLIVGNCGPGAWGSWVHERGPEWDEGGDGQGYPPFPDCVAEREDDGYQDRWIRIYEDSTWLSAMAGGPTPPVSVDDTRNMVRCGVDMVGFDRLEPFDGRLEAMVWSWAPDEPADGPALACAARGSDGRFRMRGCDETRGYACRTGTGWVVPATTGPWSDGDAACAAAGATFATPPTGWEDGLLGDADVWIPIGRTTAAMPPPPPPPPAPNDARGASGAALPRTGGAPMAWAAGALLAGGLLLARRSPRST